MGECEENRQKGVRREKARAETDGVVFVSFTQKDNGGNVLTDRDDVKLAHISSWYQFQHEDTFIPIPLDLQHILKTATDHLPHRSV